MKKLAIVITHPIQYYAPWFTLLAARKNLELRVFYTWSQSADTVKDKTFGRDIKWDVPLLEGYAYEFVENKSKQPGSHHFFGIDGPDLIPQLQSFSPDAILFFGWNFKSHLKAMRYFHGKVPVWFRGDSTLLDELGGLKSALRRLVLKMVYRYVDKAFYVGQANKAYFLKHGLSEDELIYAPHAVDNKRFVKNESGDYDMQASARRKALGYESDTIVLLYAGKFYEVKQVQLLIRAVISANKLQSKQLQLLLVGNGPQEEELKTMAQGYNFIKFMPFVNQSEMPVLYRLGDVFCLPSRSETWGLAINEAMACSRPVIVSSKVGCVQDMLLEDHNGFCFDYSSSQDLVTVLEQLSSEKLKLMGLNARQHVKNFTMLHIVEALERELLNAT